MTTAPRALARCTEPGCPWRWRSAGPDRLCPWHGADDASVNLTTRAAELGVVMSQVPGERDSDSDGGQAA